MNEKVETQLKRTVRWFSLFEELHCGRRHDRDSDYYEDVVYAFFQNCFHLIDWLHNSGVAKKDDIWDFIENHKHHEDFLLCRDLCNGSKHLTIRDPSIDRDIRLGNKHISLYLDGDSPKIQLMYFIVAQGGIYHAFHTAVGCMMLWQDYFLSKGLEMVDWESSN